MVGRLRQWQRLDKRKLLPMALLGVVLIVVLTACISSCGDKKGMELANPQFRRGVPAIRVRLTPHGQAVLATSGGYRINVDGRAVFGAKTPLPATNVSRAGRGWLINNQTVSGDILELCPAENTLFQFGPTQYRGLLRLVPSGEGQFLAINYLDLESYLAGVLAKELRTSWLSETYKAMAVAARTFARYQSQTAGLSNTYDVTDDQGSQVYGGYSAETDKSRNAVVETRGMMLVYNDNGKWGIFLTQYSACCGGTVNGAYVLRNAVALAPLVGGQTCNDCSNSSRYRWPAVRINKADAYRAIVQAYPSAAALGSLTDVRVASSTSYGRAVWLDIVGQGGTAPVRIRADDLRLAMLRAKVPAASSLYSMNCHISSVGDSLEFSEGQGFGHGVGLCQWGAEGKAEKGWKAEQILGFYYPGASLMKIY
jgi:stage II sporulation protein D